MMDLKEVRNTGLIEIGVYSVDNKEAANYRELQSRGVQPETLG
jgi:hypothetical protein